MLLRNLQRQKQNHLAALGIGLSEVKLDLKKMLEHKSEIVSGLTKGISQLFAKNKITHLLGSAQITSQGVVTIITGRDKGEFKADKNSDCHGIRANKPCLFAN